MIYKYTLRIRGSNLQPEKVFPSLKGNFTIEDIYRAGDKIWEDRTDTYDRGSIAFWHPKKFACDELVINYHNEFVEFIRDNYQLFHDNEVDDIQIFMEVYYLLQCNFEIFNRDLLKQLATFNIALPVSAYELTEEYYNNWELEIRELWSNT